MAHFYGEISSASARNGRFNTITRTGKKDRVMTAHIRGWNNGAYVNIYHDEDTGEDVVEVFKTNGSDGLLREAELVATFSESEVTINK